MVKKGRRCEPLYRCNSCNLCNAQPSRMPVAQFPRPSVEYFPRRWFTKPKFYVPIGVALVSLFVFGVYFWSVASTLSEEAKTFDLSKLEQMESASVILDRNDKIFGQIYVENGETVPYAQLHGD